VEGLRGLGYVEPETILIEYRFAAGDRDQLAGRANQLAQMHLDVLVGEGFEAAEALKRATATVPIVVFACDAVAGGLVASLTRPGGNVTGLTCITAELGAKRLELLLEAAPGVSRIAVLWNATEPAKRLEVEGISAAAKSRGLSVHSLDVRTKEDLDRAFVVARRERVGALLVLGDAFTVIHRGRIADLAMTNGLPAMYNFRQFVDAGGLMSYGPDALELFRRLAVYVDKVLKGAKPAQLPIEQPTTFELILNSKTARALSLTFPPSLAVRAHQIIE
jgi:putative ABC transport system substrate-binding protein